MAKPKRKKRIRRKIPVYPDSGNVAMPMKMPKLRQPKRVPTDIEVTAFRVSNLTEEIGRTRRFISNTEQDLTNLRATLANQMLDHQIATTKLRELALIPQPLT